MKNTNFIYALLLIFSCSLLTSSCNKDEDSSASKNALTSLNLQGIWDLNIPETHPDIFICIPFLSDEVEWAYMIINANEIDGTAKLKTSGDICNGHKTFVIKGSNHLLFLDNGQTWDLKCRLSENGSKLTFIVVDPGVSPDYPNGAYEVYNKRK